MRASPHPVSICYEDLEVNGLYLCYAVRINFVGESANVATDTQLVVPVFVNDDGSAIPHGLRAMRIGRRNYVKIAAFGKEFVLNMTHSSDFVTSSVLAGHRANDSTHEMLHAFDPTCYHRGSVMVGNVTVGRAALSACGGLVRDVQRTACV